MDINRIRKMYFVGIGGIGMSALARFFKQKGVIVNGYDRTETVLTKTLVKEGIGVTYTDTEENLKKDVDVVIYTPAIPADSLILNWYRDNNYQVFKRSDALQWITQAMFAITVAGTHGKTTTSTMIAHLLRATGYGCNAFLGGISVNYNTNYWHAENNNQVAVIEADEYDHSFLKLFPDIGVVTAMDPDHLDIYGTAEAVTQAYIDYSKNIKSGGLLLRKHGLKNGSLLQGDRKMSYSLQSAGADIYANNIRMKNGTYEFDVMGRGVYIPGVNLNIGGMHNVENCIAAIAVATQLEIDFDEIKEAVASFKGVKRRFEYVVKNDHLVYIDDYAHHPAELSSLLNSAKTLFPKKRIVIAFQPHLYSRTRDFAADFARALDLADEIILLDIYPARELPIEGINSQMLKDMMGNPNVTILSKDGLLAYAAQAPIEVFITAGAGDIDKLVVHLKEILEKR
ncbi:MAG TPA: UDP-N-acetylmuramate--L-alanine ligase [Edaphocola sp.]|nr:UDP-N-acetylmuramate--L-alanine ligase [Edaphocola sp.]